MENLNPCGTHGGHQAMEDTKVWRTSTHVGIRTHGGHQGTWFLAPWRLLPHRIPQPTATSAPQKLLVHEGDQPTDITETTWTPRGLEPLQASHPQRPWSHDTFSPMESRDLGQPSTHGDHERQPSWPHRDHTPMETMNFRLWVQVLHDPTDAGGDIMTWWPRSPHQSVGPSSPRPHRCWR